MKSPIWIGYMFETLLNTIEETALPEKCPECGAGLPDELAEKCPLCGALTAKEEKSPGIAALLSFIFAGSGQIYNGEMVKGILLLLGTLIGVLIYVVPGVIIWIYGIYDAYATSKKMNEGTIPYRRPTLANILLYIAAWIVLVIIIITIVLTGATFEVLGL
jgi:TM2 domain-containing membrane protein YozV